MAPCAFLLLYFETPVHLSSLSIYPFIFDVIQYVKQDDLLLVKTNQFFLVPCFVIHMTIALI